MDICRHPVSVIRSASFFDSPKQVPTVPSIDYSTVQLATGDWMRRRKKISEKRKLIYAFFITEKKKIASTYEIMRYLNARLPAKRDVSLLEVDGLLRTYDNIIKVPREDKVTVSNARTHNNISDGSSIIYLKKEYKIIGHADIVTDIVTDV